MEQQEDLFDMKGLTAIRRSFVRLTHKEMYTLAIWLQSNMDALQKNKTTRISAAIQATEVLGFEVRPSAVETAENMIACRMKVPRKTDPMERRGLKAEIAALKAEIAELKSRVNTLERERVVSKYLRDPIPERLAHR